MSGRLPVVIVAVLAAALLAGCGGSSSDSAATTQATPVVETVSPEQAREQIDAGGLTLLDVRTPDEFAAGHLEGATNVDFYASDFSEQLDALDPNAHYVVYCHTGNRSGQATTLMEDKGFTHVTNVDGGIAAWEAAGLPVVTGG